MSVALIVGIVIGILILRFAIGFLFKFFGILLIVGCIGIYCYQKAYWPFEKNLTSISTLEKKYCEGESAKPNKCDCIVKELKRDVNKRFTKDELTELDANRIKSAYLIKRSLEYCEPQIKKCLESKNALDELSEFKIELLQMDGFEIEAIGDWFEKNNEKLNQALDNASLEREDVDKRYQD